jgi:SAM domain (Sterile alpha motif)
MATNSCGAAVRPAERGVRCRAFEAKDIDMDLLRQIDDQALRDLGITSGGHRLRIRNGIAKLACGATIKMRALLTQIDALH